MVFKYTGCRKFLWEYDFRCAQNKFVKGIPELDNLENSIVILVILLIFVTQNIYEKGKSKSAQSISLNAHYLVIFKNRRDEAQLMYLSRQIYIRDGKFFSEVFNEATKN